MRRVEGRRGAVRRAVCAAPSRECCVRFAEFDASRPGAVRVSRDRLVRFAELDAGN